MMKAAGLLALVLVIALLVPAAAGLLPARPTAWVPVTAAPAPPPVFAPGPPASGEGHPDDATPWPTIRQTARPPTPTPEPPPPPPSPAPTETLVMLAFSYPTERVLPTTAPATPGPAPIPPIVTETFRKAGDTAPIALLAAAGATILCLRRRR